MDLTTLLPQHVKDADSSKAFEIIVKALQGEYEKLNSLVEDLFEVVTPHGSTPQTLELLARFLGLDTANRAPEQNRVALIEALTRIYQIKGTHEGLRRLSALIGYNLEAVQLWSTYAYPNMKWVGDPLNDAFFSYEPSDLNGDGQPDYPVVDGELNLKVADFRSKDRTWLVNGDHEVGSTVITVYNTDGMFQPEGDLAVFDSIAGSHTVAKLNIAQFTINPPLTRKVKSGMPVYLFRNTRIYPSSWFELKAVVPIGSDSGEFVAKLNSNLEFLSQFMPYRAKVRKVVPTYSSSEKFASVWVDVSGHCNQGLQHDRLMVPALGAVNGAQSFYFHGNHGYDILPNDTICGAVDMRALDAVFVTSSNVSTTQVLIAVGDSKVGSILYIANGQLIGGSWSFPDWGPLFTHCDILPNSWYSVRLQLSHSTGKLSLCVNGLLTEEEFGIVGLGNMQYGVSIGMASHTTRMEFSGETLDNGYPFTGHVVNVSMQSGSLSVTNRIKTNQYWQAAYNLSNPSGRITRDIWRRCAIGQSTVESLTTNRLFPNYPSVTDTVDGYKLYDSTLGYEYGVRFRCTFTPSVDGSYKFAISSMGGAVLRLSADESPANALNIANSSGVGVGELTSPSQTSAAIEMESGRSYYIEIIHKVGSVQDHLEWFLIQNGAAVQMPFDMLKAVDSGCDFVPVEVDQQVNFSGLQVGSAKNIVFQLGDVSEVTEGFLYFTHLQFVTISQLVFAVNGQVVTMEQAEFDLQAGSLKRISIPASVLINGLNTVTITAAEPNNARIDNMSICMHVGTVVSQPNTWIPEQVVNLGFSVVQPTSLVVPAGTYTSTESQSTADQLADADLSSQVSGTCIL